MLKYRSIEISIKKKINSGEYKEGERIPSIRALAHKYECSRASVIKALQNLMDRGELYPVRGSGYYVMASSKKKSEVIDFTKVKPLKTFIPNREFKICIDHVVKYYEEELFSYADPQGLESLRESINEDLRYNQVFTKKDRICITNGVQQGLDILLTWMVKKNRKRFLVEEPTYSMIFKMAQIRGIEIQRVKRDNSGIDMDALKQFFVRGEVDVFYTNPRLQNPMGTSLTEDSKKSIVHMAHAHGIRIIEDDCLGDLDVDRGRLPMHHYDMGDNVIYMKSYSKCFVPGLRLGAVILPEDMVDEIIELKRYTDLGSSIINQGALDRFLRSGLYIRNRDKIQELYRGKIVRASEFIRDRGKGIISCVGYSSGIFLWIKIQGDRDIDALVKQLRKKGVLVEDGGVFFQKYRKGKYLRLCIYSLTDQQIMKGIICIIESVKQSPKVSLEL